jgi:oligoendopeptidase F
MQNYKTSVWNLKSISPASIANASRFIEEKAEEIVAKKIFLTNNITPKKFLNIIQDVEYLRREIEKLGIYSHLRFTENSNDQKVVAEMSKVESFLTKTGNKLLFLSLWFKQLPSKKAKELIDASGKYKYYFETLRKNKKFTLKENEEKIINIKDTTGASALNNIYNMLTANFVYNFQNKKFTQEEMVTFVRSPDAKIRESAYRTILAPYIKNKTVIGEIYKNIINDWREENVVLRRYKSPINVRNEVNDIPDKAIKILLNVCEKNQYLFHKFFEIKRKRLGLKKLRRFDIYTPLKEEKETISYDKAVKLVLETFEEFSPLFKEAAEKIINNKHVHSKIQKGKASGAFCCPATTELPPFVLLSYTGKYRDVSTLAHELGHGVHMTLSQKQTEFTMDACLPLAETASIFSEMLLSEKVMKKNPKVAKEMLFIKLDDLYASIIRQAGFVSFEIKAHEMIKNGRTIDEISKVYLKDLRKQLGPVKVDDIFAYEWAYVPHIFHTPFYCYAYAFGNLLTLALYEMYKEDNKFADKIITMLAKGGSESPLEITKAVGVDICSEKFWQKGFDAIGDMIDEIE